MREQALPHREVASAAEPTQASGALAHVTQNEFEACVCVPMRDRTCSSGGACRWRTGRDTLAETRWPICKTNSRILEPPCRIDLKGGSQRHLIVDMAENFEAPDWQVALADRRRDWEAVTRGWLGRVLR